MSFLKKNNYNEFRYTEAYKPVYKPSILEVLCSLTNSYDLKEFLKKVAIVLGIILYVVAAVFAIAIVYCDGKGISFATFFDGELRHIYAGIVLIAIPLAFLKCGNALFR